MIVDGKHIGLTPEQIAERRNSIGGSDANTIMKGGEDAYNLWLVKTGQKEPDSLDDVLAVWMGTWTEPLNAAWYEKMTGRAVVCRGARRKLDAWGFLQTATLDGIVSDMPAMWEAKHVGGFEPREKIVARYYPQLHHNMHVCGLDKAVLSVFEGNSKYWYEEVDLDPVYMEDLLDREKQFWYFVTSKIWTGDWTPIEATVPTTFREVDMSTSNLWADQAMQWLQHRDAKKAFDAAEKEIKSMVERDVSRAYGHGIECKRDRSNKLKIGEL